MPLIMRRTPENERAYGYNFPELMRDVLSRVNESRNAASRRMLAGSPTEDDLMGLLFAGIGGGVKFVGKAATEVPLILRKFAKEGLTYDAYVNQIPDKPQFAYHQWTFRGEGPLERATVTTRGTGMDEFLAMYKDRLRKFTE